MQTGQIMASSASRYALAPFQDWPELLIAVAALADEPEASHALSFVSRSELFDEPDLQSSISVLEPALQHAIENRVNLEFRLPYVIVSCTAGLLADQLAGRLKQGSARLADAFGAWMTGRQAARIDDDIQQSMTLLWARILSPQQEQSTCETLLRVRPLRVEVHDLVSVSPPPDRNRISGNKSG
jgi:hypothetical protein